MHSLKADKTTTTTTTTTAHLMALIRDNPH